MIQDWIISKAFANKDKVIIQEWVTNFELDAISIGQMAKLVLRGLNNLTLVLECNPNQVFLDQALIMICGTVGNWLHNYKYKYQAAEMLLSKGASLNNIPNEALHRAFSRKEDKELQILLLRRGASPHILEVWQRKHLAPLLHRAARMENWEAVTLLVAANVDMDALYKNETARDVAKDQDAFDAAVTAGQALKLKPPMIRQTGVLPNTADTLRKLRNLAMTDNDTRGTSTSDIIYIPNYSL